MGDERIKLRILDREPIEDYIARKQREDERPPVIPAEDDDVDPEFVQPRIPGRHTWNAKTGKRDPKLRDRVPRQTEARARARGRRRGSPPGLLIRALFEKAPPR
jgi:hypothetical protein